MVMGDVVCFLRGGQFDCHCVMSWGVLVVVCQMIYFFLTLNTHHLMSLIISLPPQPKNANHPPPINMKDMKRGYCFVFLKDPETLADKERTENYVHDINGMYVNNNNYQTSFFVMAT